MNNTLTLSFPFLARMPLWANRALILKIVSCLLALSVTCLVGLYLFQTGDLLAKSFVLKQYEVKMEELSKANVGLYADVRMVSLEALEQRINEIGFVKTGQIRYIPISPEQLVTTVK